LKLSIYQVAYKNLLRRKVRTSLTILGIVISTWVFVTLLGFNHGYENSLNENIEGMGFQIVLTAKGCPYEAATLMLQGGTGLRYMPENLVRSVIDKPQVERATPMIMHAEFDPNRGETGGTTIYLGIDAASYPPMKPYLAFSQGTWFASDAENQVVLGYEVAELEQREAGDLMLLPGTTEEYEVVGVLKRTGNQDDGMIYMPLFAAQKTFNREGELTMLGMRLVPEIDQAAFEEELYQLPDVQVVSMAQVKNTIMGLVSSAKAIVLSVACIAFLIAIFGVVNTVLMSVFERYQEIGILKSMGALPGDIFKMVFIETTILCAFGGLLGIGFSWIFSGMSELAVRYFLPFSPSGKLIIINGSTALFSFIAIACIGMLGSVYPAWRAASVRPLESIRNE
jgi:putative ABC transport system permease protein